MHDTPLANYPLAPSSEKTTEDNRSEDSRRKNRSKDRSSRSRSPSRYREDADAFLVVLDESEKPQNLQSAIKWRIVTVVCMCTVLVQCASSLAAFTQRPLQEEFGVSEIISILPLSLFVQGLAVGQLFVAPFSELYGRRIIYRFSFVAFLLVTIPVTFAPNIAVHLVFRALSGLCCSCFLSVAGGTMSDLFSDDEVATPMALYTIAVFMGPVLGPWLGGFIVQHLYWRWVYRILLIWTFTHLVIIFFLVPETFAPVLARQKARCIRQEAKDPRYWCSMERNSRTLGGAMFSSFTMPFKLVAQERMILLLNVWNSLLFGIEYMAFQAFPIIFRDGHGFDVQSTGLSFTGLGVGMVLAAPFQVVFNRRYSRCAAVHAGHPPSEIRLEAAQVGAILIPVSLFIIAFTSYSHVHWIIPILASVPFGLGISFSFISTLTYLVTVYRPMAASVLASNVVMRATFAAAFPLFAGAMYGRLGSVGATALLGGLCTVMAPLPFIFARVGARLRSKSKFALGDT